MQYIHSHKLRLFRLPSTFVSIITSYKPTMSHFNISSSSFVLEQVADASPLKTRIILSVIFGIVLHQYVFRKGEWHLHAPQLFAIWLISYPSFFTVEYMFLERHIFHSLSRATLTFGCTMIAIFASMVTYRLLFHSLCKFPGPKLAATSKLWHSYQCWNGKNHLVLDDLRSRYGDYVRTGLYFFTADSFTGFVEK